MKFFEFLYFVGTQFYFFGIRCASFFNAKAKKAIVGRQNLELPTNLKGAIWFHCASLGEFEQGRPLIERIKKETPDKKIVLTFFSPSGFEIRKRYEYADFVGYLPFDSPKNADGFLNAFQPSTAIFVKYEFWYFYLKALKNREIPIFLISAVFKKEQVFFRRHGGFFRHLLTFFTTIFVQGKESHKLLTANGLENVEVAGDTRVDRVLEIASQNKKMPEVEAFCGEENILVVGSSWGKDEKIIFPFLNNELPENWKVIIAPHEVDEEHLQQIESGLDLSFVRYSKLTLTNLNNPRVLIIDNIGMLSALYRFGKIAYIGGGFGAGIHNTLEPIAHGLPVIFGPKYQKFSEAVALVRTGGGFVIKNEADFKKVISNLFEKEQLKQASKNAKAFVQENQGATELIYSKLKEFVN